MTNTDSERLQHQERFCEVLAAYIEATETDGVTDPYDWIAQHPEFAADLAKFIANQDKLDRLAAPLRAVARAATFASEFKRLGDFRLIREIGRGGMGVVYEAEQLSFGRRMALKVLPFAAVLDPKQLKRFKNEAQAAATLDHPNIVSVHSVGCERGVHYYAMPLVEGQSLAEVIDALRSDVPSAATSGADSGDTSSPTSGATAGLSSSAVSVDTKPVALLTTEQSTTSPAFFRSVARLGIQAAEALEHAHQSGIVHRDIKPSNLMVDAAGHLSITDFGLAMTQTGGNLTMSGDLLGTLRYMSPEQAAGNRLVLDHRTDIYSLGITLHELLTLRPAFPGNDRQVLIRDVAEQEPRRPRQENPAIPQDLETIVLKATAKERDTRYRSAQELADDLVRFIEDKPIRAKRPGPLVRLQKWTRRHKALTATAAVVLILAAVIAGGLKLERDRQYREIERSLTNALTAAHTAIEAKDYALAEDKLLEAEGRIAGVHSDLPSAAGDIRALHEELTRFQEFNRLAGEAHINTTWNSSVQSPALRALALYGVMERSDWVAELERTPLHADMRGQIVSTAYEMLFLLADDQVRWKPRRYQSSSARQGLAYLEKALTFHAPTRGAYWLRAKCRRLLGETDAAQADADRMRRTPGTIALDHFLPGRDAAWSRRHDEAVQEYHAALRLDRGHFVSLCMLGLSLEEQERYDEALVAFIGSLAIRPQTSFVHAHLFRLLSLMGRHEQALAEYNWLLNAEPEAVAFHNVAFYLANQPNPQSGDFARALRLAELGVETLPKDAGLWSVLGQARYRTDDYQGEVEALAKSIELDFSRKARSWFFLAMAHWNLGNKDEARDYFEKAAEWMQDNDPPGAGFPASQFRDEAAELLRLRDDLPEQEVIPIQ